MFASETLITVILMSFAVYFIYIKKTAHDNNTQKLDKLKRNMGEFCHLRNRITEVENIHVLSHDVAARHFFNHLITWLKSPQADAAGSTISQEFAMSLYVYLITRAYINDIKNEMNFERHYLSLCPWNITDITSLGVNLNDRHSSHFDMLL